MGADTIASRSRTSDTRAVLDSVRGIVRALRISSRACEKLSGLTSAQIFVLQQLKSHASLSVNEVAERTFTHQSTVSEVLGRLAGSGLISRKTSKKDARRSDVLITPRGLSALKKAPKTAQEKLADAIGAMPTAQRRTLAKLVSRLVVEAGFHERQASLFFEDGKKP